jgi:drug/metabolite transporter (DMT)-like permease
VGARRWNLLVIGGGAQMAIAGLAVASLRFIPPATSAFLFYTYPTWVAVLAVLRRTERVDGAKAAALALSFAGILLMVGNPLATQLDPRGIACSLGAAVVYALMLPWLGALQAGLKPAAAATWIAIGAFCCFFVVALALRTPLVPPSSSLLINAGGLAVIATAMAFTALMSGLAELGPVRTSIVSTVEPFFTALLAGVVLGQQVGARTWIGGAMIALAMVLLQRKGAAAGTAAA